jgi:hypothetical protein
MLSSGKQSHVVFVCNHAIGSCSRRRAGRRGPLWQPLCGQLLLSGKFDILRQPQLRQRPDEAPCDVNLPPLQAVARRVLEGWVGGAKWGAVLLSGECAVFLTAWRG